MYLISRIATRNPDINGRTLYLTDTGLWTLDPAYARRFATRAEAEKRAPADATVVEQ